jgi:hypothetical protein
MFPYPIATPQGCDIQTFYGNDTTLQTFTWNKPVGVSHVYMMLIGAGGTGDGTNGGGSGAVTVWYGAAQNVPNTLVISPASSANGTVTSIRYRGNSFLILLQAQTSGSYLGAGASAASAFAASGFYKSTAGQDGSAGSPSASTTTFLSGGGATNTATVTANYGYALSASTASINGTFLMQPIIVGIGGKFSGKGGIGCGGGVTGKGGPGMVLIASW